MVTLHTNTGIISVWELESQGEIFLWVSRGVALVKDSDLTFHVDLKGNSCNFQWITWEERFLWVQEIHWVHLKGSYWRHRHRRGCSTVSFGYDLMAYSVPHFMLIGNYRTSSSEKQVFPFYLKMLWVLRIILKGNMEKKNEALRIGRRGIRKQKRKRASAL